MKPRIANARGFVGILTILLGLVVVGFLYFVMLNPYRTQPALENSVGKALEEQHINTSTYQSILKSTTSEVKRLEQLQLEKAQDLDLYKIPGE